jgi:hypothetical protein
LNIEASRLLGCVEVPDFGAAVPAGVTLRIAEYDTDGFLDETPDTDHEGKECYVRQFQSKEPSGE